MTKVCPLCNGEGKTILAVPHPFLEKKFKTVVQWCLCKKAQFVSESPENTLLSYFEGDIVPLDKINPELEFNPIEIHKNSNLLIRGHYNTFCNHLRSFVIKYRYGETLSSIYCCDSIDILQRFYVEQNDRTCLNLSETVKYDLLVLCFGNRQKNDPLKTCVAEVVYLRKKKNRPTWIYMPFPTLELCVWEKSPELEEYLKDYKSITIAEEGTKIDRTPKAVNNNAANFNGVSK